MNTTNVFKIILALCISILTIDAVAYKAGDIIVRAGAATVEPREDTSIVTLNGADAFAGSELGIDNNTQLGLTFSYMINSHWGIELLAATPFEHNVTGRGALGAAVPDVAEVKHLPPTLSAVYYPIEDGTFQPYIGLGLNYTFIFDEEGSDALEAFAGSKTDIDLDDSVGLSAQIGADFQLSDKWHLNASVRWVNIETDAEITVQSGALAGAKIEAEVDINPFVYTISLGYKY